MQRITARFAELRAKNRKAFVPFVMAGDPDYASAKKLLLGLAGAGADLIELGMPFSDPMADGPTIQAAGIRALQAKQTLERTLKLAKEFRQQDKTTPLILMGYYNPIYSMGVAKFLRSAKQAGIDGLIIVDLPPEEDDELCIPAQKAGLAFIRLLTPTTDSKRLKQLLARASGFLYYVAIAGVTGTKRAESSALKKRLATIRKASKLPLLTGFGITTPAQAKQIATLCDGAVIGSALVAHIGKAKSQGRAKSQGVANALAFARQLGKTIHSVGTK